MIFYVHGSTAMYIQNSAYHFGTPAELQVSKFRKSLMRKHVLLGSRIQLIYIDLGLLEAQLVCKSQKGIEYLLFDQQNTSKTTHYVCNCELVSCKTFRISNMHFNVCKIYECVVGIQENPESASDLLGSSAIRLALNRKYLLSKVKIQNSFFCHNDEFRIQLPNPSELAMMKGRWS